MGALESKDIARRLTGSRELIGTAIGKLERRAWVGAGSRTHVPLVGYRDLFRESEGQVPAAERGSAGIGDRYINLESSTPRIGRRTCTAVCCKCLIAQQ